MPTTKPRIKVTLEPEWLAVLWRLPGTSMGDKIRRKLAEVVAELETAQPSADVSDLFAEGESCSKH